MAPEQFDIGFALLRRKYDDAPRTAPLRKRKNRLADPPTFLAP